MNLRQAIKSCKDTTYIGFSIGKCLFCKKDFYTIHKYVSFCSNPCSRHRLKRGRFINCKICGKSVWRTRDVLLKSKNNFCSIKCFKIAFIGQNSPRYKHGFAGAYRRGADGTGTHTFEHRMLMERRLGRQLTRNEVVHHINHNKLDNRIENLELMDNHSLHINSELVYWRKHLANCGCECHKDFK